MLQKPNRLFMLPIFPKTYYLYLIPKRLLFQHIFDQLVRNGRSVQISPTSGHYVPRLFKLAKNRSRADLPPSRTQSRVHAAACSPYSEKRKARNRTTIPPMGVAEKRGVDPAPPESRRQSLAGMRKYQTKTPVEPSERTTQSEGRNQYFQQYLHHQNLLYSFYLYFTMPAWGHKCRKRLVNPVPSVLLHPVFS